MKSHRNSEFGIGAVQVYIDGNQPKDRDLPATTINVVGIQTQITLYVAPGQPKLEDQIYRLRKAAGQAFLHTAELDRQLPPWTCDGLASFIAVEGLSPEEIQAAAEQVKAPGSPRLGGQQWRAKRIEQDRLNMPEVDSDAAALEVEFLLTASDAAHVPEFFAAIGDSMNLVQQRRVQGSIVTARRGEEQPAKHGPVDDLAIKLARPFEEWHKSPLAGQPKLVLDEKSPIEIQQAELEMAVALKLAKRFSVPRQGTVRTRITTFDKSRGAAVLSSKSENRTVPLPELFQQMVAPERPVWGTLDANGQLVLSIERQAVQQMLGLDGNKYRWESSGDRNVLSTTVDGKWKLQGWLEENKEEPARPLAKFTVTKVATR
jgi:hypothetical protein